jgi:hypothetical protein
MFAAIETVTKADTVGLSRRHKSDIAAQTSAGKWLHAGSPMKIRAARIVVANAAGPEIG